MTTPLDVLMIEDNRGDAVLVQAAMEKLGLTHRLTVITDGLEAVDYLYRRGTYAGAARPDLILLDLKLPKKDGREVLDAILPDAALREIPLVLLSSSLAELELARSYGLPGECHIEKPSTYQGFIDLVNAVERFRIAMIERQLQGGAI